MKILKFLSGLFPKKPIPKEVRDVFDKLAKIVFPDGDSQIDEETELLHVILNRRVSIADTRKILIRTKGLFYMINYNDKTSGVKFVSDQIRNSTSAHISDEDVFQINKFYVGYFHLEDRCRIS